MDAVINAFLLAQWSMHLRGAQCSMNICEYGGQCIFLVSTVVNALLLVHSGQCIFVITVVNALAWYTVVDAFL